MKSVAWLSYCFILESKTHFAICVMYETSCITFIVKAKKNKTTKQRSKPSICSERYAATCDLQNKKVKREQRQFSFCSRATSKFFSSEFLIHAMS